MSPYSILACIRHDVDAGLRQHDGIIGAPCKQYKAIVLRINLCQQTFASSSFHTARAMPATSGHFSRSRSFATSFCRNTAYPYTVSSGWFQHT